MHIEGSTVIGSAYIEGSTVIGSAYKRVLLLYILHIRGCYCYR